MGILIGLLYLGIVGVVFGREEVALGHGDAVEHSARTVCLGVEVEVLDYLLDGRLAVVGVVDGEGAYVAQFLRL